MCKRNKYSGRSPSNLDNLHCTLSKNLNALLSKYVNHVCDLPNLDKYIYNYIDDRTHIVINLTTFPYNDAKLVIKSIKLNL